MQRGKKQCLDWHPVYYFTRSTTNTAPSIFLLGLVSELLSLLTNLCIQLLSLLTSVITQIASQLAGFGAELLALGEHLSSFLLEILYGTSILKVVRQDTACTAQTSSSQQAIDQTSPSHFRVCRSLD